jgi:hypothetical protein
VRISPLLKGTPRAVPDRCNTLNAASGLLYICVRCEVCEVELNVKYT